MESIQINSIWNFKCFDPDGNLKWEEEGKNLVVTEGLNHILNTEFHGGTPITTWYIGLKNAGTYDATHTLATHSGWTENDHYTGTRKEFVETAASSGSLSNTGNVASFVFDADSQTIAGGFLCSATSGTSGTLFSVKDFDASKGVDTDDTLQVTVTITASV